MNIELDNKFIAGGVTVAAFVIALAMIDRTPAAIAIRRAPLSASQRQQAFKILGIVRRKGYPGGLALAMIANAMRESQLNPKAIGDNGASVGLFQINIVNGPFKPDKRKNPAWNTKWILQDRGMSAVDNAIARNETAATVSGNFAQYVERCRECSAAEKSARILEVSRLFGNKLANMPAMEIK